MRLPHRETQPRFGCCRSCPHYTNNRRAELQSSLGSPAAPDPKCGACAPESGRAQFGGITWGYRLESLARSGRRQRAPAPLVGGFENGHLQDRDKHKNAKKHQEFRVHHRTCRSRLKLSSRCPSSERRTRCFVHFRGTRSACSRSSNL